VGDLITLFMVRRRLLKRFLGCPGQFRQGAQHTVIHQDAAQAFAACLSILLNSFLAGKLVGRPFDSSSHEASSGVIETDRKFVWTE
jgi:hypothetical protein